MFGKQPIASFIVDFFPEQIVVQQRMKLRTWLQMVLLLKK